MSVRLKHVSFAIAAASLLSGCWAQQALGQWGCSGEQSVLPNGEIAPSDFVELKSTSSCMDPCPVYSVRVRADGTVTWDGQSGVQTKGPATRQVSAEAARALIESYRAAGFWHLCQGVSGGEDGPEVSTTVHIGNSEKSINGTPDWKIYRSVGALAETYYWIRGDPQLESVSNSRLSDNDFAPKPGFTDLMRAASRGDVSGIERELMAGAKVNAQDSSGFTALMCATRTRNREALTILLQAGADANLRSNLGQTAIMAASAGSALSEEALGMLIAAGGDLNAQDRDGVSALMLAAPHAEPALISFMLKAGARRDALDAAGHTALDRVASALWSVESESEAVKNLNIGNKAQRQAGLETRRSRLQQVRALLLQQ